MVSLTCLARCVVVLLTYLSCSVASCDPTKPLKPVSLALHWQHQAQFAGYYMALAKGFYNKEGIDLRLIKGGPNVHVGQLVNSRQADFGSLMLSQAIGDRTNGIPLVHLAQVVNRSNFLLMAWRKTQDNQTINALTDLAGRKVTIWAQDFRAPYLAMFAAHSIQPVVLPQYGTFSLFLYRGADAFAGMRYNEYHALLQSGILDKDISVFPLKDNGVNMPEDGLYCLADTWKRMPKVSAAFVRASMNGWRYARDHKEETLDVVMNYVNTDNLPTNRPHMSWMLNEIIDSIFPGKNDTWIKGQLSRAAYDDTINVLSKYGSLPKAPKYDEFVVGDEIYGSL